MIYRISGVTGLINEMALLSACRIRLDLELSECFQIWHLGSLGPYRGRPEVTVPVDSFGMFIPYYSKT